MIVPRKSTGEYPPEWGILAWNIKKAAGWKCVRCGAQHDPSAGNTLTVHHLDLDKSNCRWHNLVALCQRCHLQIQHKVYLSRPWLYEHTQWFKPFAAGYYAHRHDLPQMHDLVTLPEVMDLLLLADRQPEDGWEDALRFMMERYLYQWRIGAAFLFQGEAE